MFLDKEIEYLLKLNRSNFNIADMKIKRVLLKIYEKGKKQGKKEQRAELKKMLK